VAWQDPSDPVDLKPAAQAERNKRAKEREARGLPAGDTAPYGPVRVTVSDPDGSNSREVYKSSKGRMMAFEWR
jgi:hypothetical protein